MELTDYLTRRRSLAETAIRGVVKALTGYATRPAYTNGISPTRDNVRTLWAEVFTAIEQPVTEAAENARDWFDEEWTRVTGDPAPDVYRIDVRQEWEASRFNEPLREFMAEPNANTLKKMGATAADAVKGADRSQTRYSGRQAEEVTGKRVRYARVETGSRSCAFCLVLISRGPVYVSSDSAGVTDKYHPNCDCRVVAVIGDDTNWPGHDQWKAAEEIYKKASRRAGAESTDILTAMRRHLDGRPIVKKEG